MNKLLTISIPTYNRSANLKLLLDTLIEELNGVESLVEVIVSDNASTDETSSVLVNFKKKLADAIVINNTENLGADLNISACFEKATSRFVWIIGDDDLPKSGAIKEILSILQNNNLHMIYVQSEWTVKIESADQGVINSTYCAEKMGQEEFAKRVNVWLTFISGIIINKEYLRNHVMASPPLRYSGTNLIQLEWVLDALKHGKYFMYISSPCVLATAGNSGGYAPLTVFAVNFPRLVKQVFGNNSVICKNILKKTVVNYLPSFIWCSRFSNIGKFEGENPWDLMNDELGEYKYYRYMLVPIGRYPKWLARLFLWASQIFVKFIK